MRSVGFRRLVLVRPTIVRPIAYQSREFVIDVRIEVLAKSLEMRFKYELDFSDVTYKFSFWV